MRVLTAIFFAAMLTACASPTTAPTPTGLRAPAQATATPPRASATQTAALIHAQADISNLHVDDVALYFSTCKSPATPNDVVGKIARATGKVETLAMEQTCPSPILADATHLYWVSLGKIFRVAKDAGKIQAVGSLTAVNGLVIDEAALYASVCESRASGAIVQVTKATGGTQDFLKLARCPRVVAADATHIYFTTSDRDAGDELHRVKKTGGAAEKIATLARYPVVAQNIIADDAMIYWTTRQDPGKPQGDADDYNSILALNKANLASKPIANQQARPSALALDAANLFWSNCGTLRFNFENTALVRAPKAGGAAATLAPGICANALAVDAQNIFAATKEGVLRVNK